MNLVDGIFKTRLAQENWTSKYQYDNETPIETQLRAAKALASVEKEEVRKHWEDKFFNTLVNVELNEEVATAVGLKNTLGGRITANIGTEFNGATLMNCYINGPVYGATLKYKRSIPGTDEFINIELTTEDTPDNLANIILTVLEQALTLKSEGGWGINFDWIRPRASIISSLGVQHPGVVRYMEIFDKISEIIVMGNTDGYKDTLKDYLEGADRAQVRQIGKKLKKMARKGAMMGVLSIWHPDIEEFVRAKQTPGVLTKFNISVMVDDKFMQAVEDDDFYDLHFNGVVYKRIKAKELYELIMQSTYNRAEPGILFYDNMQRNNPIAYLGDINATNPCGEIGGNPKTSTVCLLGSINLTQYIGKDRKFNWDAYKADVEVFARMLDNVNDLTYTPLAQYQWATKNIRQYGMGINGLGSALYMMGIAYNSPEAIEFTDQVNWWKEEICWRTSALLAAEKGPFPAYNEKFLETHWFTKFTRISDETKALIREHGVRNAKTTTNPPLGNSSIVCDIISNGIEPVFMHEYQRKYIADKWPDGLSVDNVKLFLSETKEGDATVWQGKYNDVMYHYEPHNRGLCIIENVRDYGYQWVLDNYPEDIINLTLTEAYPVVGDTQEFQDLMDAGYKTVSLKNNYLVTTENLTVEDHVNIQVVTQRNINQSVSKTANIPNDYPFEDFKQLYLNAWKKGLNGFTTYRDGSMEAVLTKIEKDKKVDEVTRPIIKSGLRLPDTYLNGPGKIVEKEGMKFYMHLSYHPEDSNMEYPIALWINTNHTGETVAANAAVRELVKLLRSFEIEEELIQKQLDKVKGTPSHQRVSRMVSMCLRHNLPITSVIGAIDNLEEDYISSMLTAVRKFLSSQVKDGSPVIGKKCLSCGSEKIIFESGCNKCLDCGSGSCG